MTDRKIDTDEMSKQIVGYELTSDPKSGSQYLSKINEQLYLASHNTCVFILQNESGNV